MLLKKKRITTERKNPSLLRVYDMLEEKNSDKREYVYDI